MIVDKPIIQSPLNYTGGKYKLLPQLLSLFPDDIATFVDVFCGGGNVGVNVRAKNVIMNDSDVDVVLLLQMFLEYDSDNFVRDVLSIIERYQLSRVCDHSYAYYGADSADGLANINREGFIKLRNDFNSRLYNKVRCLYLYVLIVYAFNNQIRFNKDGEFNLPVGKRDFNSRMQRKVVAFIERMKLVNPQIVHSDFRQIRMDQFSSDDFFYLDPPYLITCATYNEKGNWTEDSEFALYDFLDDLQSRQLRFALSNVLSSKGKKNTILEGWLHDNEGRYFCHHINKNYSNSSYHTNDRTSGSDEVLITNYLL